MKNLITISNAYFLLLIKKCDPLSISHKKHTLRGSKDSKATQYREYLNINIFFENKGRFNYIQLIYNS